MDYEKELTQLKDNIDNAKKLKYKAEIRVGITKFVTIESDSITGFFKVADRDSKSFAEASKDRFVYLDCYDRFNNIFLKGMYWYDGTKVERILARV